GEPQKKYAELLGFPINNILTGFYCCDYNFFNSQYLKAKACKQLKFPKRFIYVGRYVAQKGIEDLWNAFVTLHEKHPNDWELWCLGTGDIPPFQHPRIKHFGFVQPSDMSHFIENAGVFVLPSYFEPWGVVIHEFATAGFPIICSDRVGARVNFVENNINGYIYTSRNKMELMSAMLKIVQSTDKTLNEMSVQSTKKASLITPEIWAQKLISLI
ncbi:MAG TPA: glycosyltransferase, partial [Chitinophagales bacterium]|nr:glycosyltransferase [Chitinophagales bacterium]